MKKTQFKDALRNIGKRKISFLSIVVIAALGVTLFLGIDYAAETIRNNGTAFYRSVNYRDIEAVSTLLFSEEDLDAVRAQEGVKDAEGIFVTGAKAVTETQRRDVNVVSLTQRINLPVLTEGRLPVGAEECAAETQLAEQMGWKTGDRIELGVDPQYLRGQSFEIVGLAVHPDHICGSVPETLYIMVTKEAFDTEQLDGCFMKIEITADAAWSAVRFDTKYRKILSPVMDRIETLGYNRAAVRENTVKEAAQEKLEESREALREAEAQLLDGRAELEDAKAQLAEGRKQLINGWDVLEDAKEEIRTVISAKIKELTGAAVSVLIPWAQKEKADIEDPAVSAKIFRITERYSIPLAGSVKEIIRQAVGSEQMPEAVLKAVFALLGSEGEYDPEKAKDLLADAVYTALGDSLSEVEDLLAGCAAWDEALETYRDGKVQIAEGEEKIAAAEAALEEGREKLAEAEKSVEALPPCRWILLDSYGNSGFVQLASSRENLKGLEMTFSLLFVLVGAMVIYATISKMVDEQRTLVGTTKALGFFRSEIFAKYLSFGAAAMLLGFLLGLLLARFWVEGFILKGYQLYYKIGITKTAFAVPPTLIVLAAGFLLAFGAVWFACAKLLKTPAIRLMQPAVPQGKRKTAAGRRHVLSLYSRLILRNIRTDWKRVMVTVFSVGGCCALIVIGFTLRHAVNGAVEHQFTDVVRYDAMIRFDPDAGEDVAEGIGKVLRSAGTECCPVTDVYITVKIRDLEIQELYCGDLSAISRMHSLSDITTGEPLVPSDEGIYIAKRFSEVYGIGKGDRLEITLNGTETVTAAIAGVFNNYMNRTMMMSEGCFRTLFGRDPEPNAWMVKLGGADAGLLEEVLREVEGFESYRPADEFRQLFAAATKVMNAVVLLFIFMAAIMAGVVVMNLTNIYIMQKKRELTVMRVNGFTVKEVIRYVTRETVLTTAAGILAGIAMGSFLAYRIIRALEQPFIQFDRGVSVASWLIGFGMTVVFTVVINSIVLRKVKDLKLTDVA